MVHWTGEMLLILGFRRLLLVGGSLQEIHNLHVGFLVSVVRLLFGVLLFLFWLLTSFKREELKYI